MLVPRYSHAVTDIDIGHEIENTCLDWLKTSTTPITTTTTTTTTTPSKGAAMALLCDVRLLIVVAMFSCREFFN